MWKSGATTACNLLIVKRCFVSFINFYFHCLIQTLCISFWFCICLRLFMACVSCCFKSSSLISCLLILTVKLLIVEHKILCYGGRRQASPHPAHNKTTVFKACHCFIIISKGTCMCACGEVRQTKIQEQQQHPFNDSLTDTKILRVKNWARLAVWVQICLPNFTPTTGSPADI